MFCVKCGTKLNDDALFCNKCGARQNGAVEQTATVNASTGGVVGAQKKPSGAVSGINASMKLLMAGAAAVILVIVLFLAFGGGKDETAKVKDTLGELELALNEAYNLSAIVDDRSMDDSNLAALFTDRATYNQSFGGVDFASDFRELQSLLQVLNSGSRLGSELLEDMPFVGGALADFTEKELKNDALFDAKKWNDAMKFKIHVEDVEMVSKTEATAEIELVQTINLSFLNDSKIILLLGGMPDVISDSNEIPLYVELEKVDGKWKISGIEGK